MLDVKNYESWSSEIKLIIDRYIDDALFKEFTQLENYIEIYDITNVIGENIIYDVQNYIKSNFNYLVLYHATATDNIQSYLEKGLLPLDSKRMINYARSIFNQDDFPEITDKIFQKAIDEVITNDKHFKEHRENIICFSVDDELILEKSSSHYLLYGGETLLHIAQHIGHNYPKILEDKFTPTLLKCKVPFQLLKTSIYKLLSESLIVRYCENIIYPNDLFYPIDITPYITNILKPEYIISYDNPKNIKCDVKTMCGYY